MISEPKCGACIEDLGEVGGKEERKKLYCELSLYEYVLRRERIINKMWGLRLLALPGPIVVGPCKDWVLNVLNMGTEIGSPT